jgi:hypothetical protein
MAGGMLRAPLLALLAGAVIAGTLLRVRRDPPPVHLHVPVPEPVEQVLPGPTHAASPAPTILPHHLSCGAPVASIGTPMSEVPKDADSGKRYWRVVAGARTCVIAVWSDADLVASWDDGASFAPVPGSGAKIVGVAVRDDGTIFVMREDFTLGVIYPDGRVLTRHLAFRGEPEASGKWLVIYTRPSISISDDDGATWRQLGGVEDSILVYASRLRVLDDGTLVAHADWHGAACDHFGCAEPAEGDVESHLDGGAWREATPAHARALGKPREASVLPPFDVRNGWDVVDSHDLLLHVIPNRREIVRYLGKAGWRLLYTGAP